NFVAAQPNHVWLADITYIPTSQGWLYLAVILDLFTRKVVGWAMRDHRRAKLTIAALTMAIQRQRPGAGLIHHSDRGSQGGFNSSSQHDLCWPNLATPEIDPALPHCDARRVHFDRRVASLFSTMLVAQAGQAQRRARSRPDRSERRRRLVIATSPANCCDDHLSSGSTPPPTTATSCAAPRSSNRSAAGATAVTMRQWRVSSAL